MRTIFTETVYIRCKEGTASHACIYITVLKLTHLLSGDVVGNHTLSRTFCRKNRKIPILAAFTHIILIKNIDKLRECGCDKHSLFILNSRDPLLKNLFYYERKIVTRLTLGNLIQIHKYSNKRSLSVRGHKSYHLILDHLHAALYLIKHAKLSHFIDPLLIKLKSRCFKLFLYLLPELFTTHLYKGRKMRKRNALSAVL